MTSLPIPDEFIDAVARRVIELTADQRPVEAEPWLNVDQAAEYLAAPKSRVYDLVERGRLQYRKDGRRVLLRREWLDAYLDTETRRAA